MLNFVFIIFYKNTGLFLNAVYDLQTLHSELVCSSFYNINQKFSCHAVFEKVQLYLTVCPCNN